MDGLVHAALDAEGILNRTRNVSTSLSPFESRVQDHKMTWTHGNKMHLAEPADETRPKYHRNSVGSVILKPTEKFDLFKKLHELHEELSHDESIQSNFQGLKSTSYILEKLLLTYNLNTLIINLYPGNKGYSLSLKINGYLHPVEGSSSSNPEESLIETTRWPYEEEELLSYIDNEEIPVVLLDLLEAEHSCLFYSGCIIAQIRDYRQTYPNPLCDMHHVLLKPSNQSILTDAMCISSRCGWSNEERSAFESALVMATAPPLCLDPRPSVGQLSAKLHSAPRLLNTPRIRRQARRFSQVAVNRKRKLDQFTHYHGLELLDMIHRQRARNSRQSVPHTRLTSKFPKKPPESFKPIEPPRMDPLPLALPSEPHAALRLARAYERPRPSPDCYPLLVEEYILETEKSPPHTGAGFFHIKLSILQRPADQEFLGELYVDRDHVEGERNGASCRFSLGSRIQANKYIQQFTEIFTEEGRKSVRIKHIVPGQLPRVSFTGGMRDLAGQQLLLQQQQRAAAAAAAAAAASSASTVQTHATPVPVMTTAISATPLTHTTARSIPLLAQLQSGVGGVGGVGGVTAVGVSPDTHLTQQPSPTTPRLSPQVHDLHSSQASTNQLLAQQLTNPPQPLNPQKLQPAIIHIPHQLITTPPNSQIQNVQYSTATSTQAQKATLTKPRTTNPAISALVTSLMNSAQQFQAANQNAKPSTSTVSSNATILNLLNSAPAVMSHATSSTSDTAVGGTNTVTVTSDGHKLLGRTVSLAGARLIATVTTTSQTIPSYTPQVMSYTVESSDATNVSSSESALLERLIAPAENAQHTQPQQQTMCHVQGLSLASLQGLSGVSGLSGVQNVQVQIPGLSSPISLSLNVSGAGGGLLVSVPPTTSVVLTNQPNVLSLPIAQLVGGVGTSVSGSGAGVALYRGGSRSRPPHNIGNAQFITQAQALNTHQVRRKSNPPDGS